MSERNGNLLKIIGIVTTLLIVGAGVIVAFTNIGHLAGDNADDIKTMQPDVKQNTEHRIKFEEKVNTMADSIEAIRSVVEK
ncbi:hypothetical protein LCGC14_0357560 [marine sediment metagenome]|uniref:Uncharacterized protein n=1 Tax=marine sediment metagenome TaxID=412755 RepID=A0A0F9VVZ5_9ZZZZ